MLSGSTQANILPGVAAIHSIWIKQHNRVARQLRVSLRVRLRYLIRTRYDYGTPQALNTHWTDDKLYEESRKIVSAQLQHVTYNEFLPILLGNDNIK